jgi:chromosomal replication initiation ATPase DnaA
MKTTRNISHHYYLMMMSDTIEEKALKRVRKVTIDELKTLTNDYILVKTGGRFPYGLSSKARIREVVEIRQVYYYLAYLDSSIANYSLQTIGHTTGHDHATVIHGITKTENLLKLNDPRMIGIHKELKSILNDFINNRTW